MALLTYLKNIYQIRFHREENKQTLNFLNKSDDKKVRKFNKKYQHYRKSIVGISTLRNGTQQRVITEKTTMLDDLKLFQHESCNEIRNCLSSYMYENSLLLFLYYCIDIMEEYKFNMQPSVNLASEDSSRPNGNFDENSSYKIFSNISLLDHTRNVVVEFIEYYKESRTLLSERELAVLALSCLFHDFGKSKVLAKSFDFNVTNMTNGKYSHEIYSADIVMLLAESFDHGGLLRNSYFKHDFERVQDIVLYHHSKITDTRRPDDFLIDVLKEIDARARRKELYLAGEGLL